MRDAFRVLGGNEPDWGGLVTKRSRVMGTPRPSRRLLTAIVPVVLFALLAIPAASANANHQAVGRGTTTEFICANGGSEPRHDHLQCAEEQGDSAGAISDHWVHRSEVRQP